jgi:hypothetical protein
MPERPLLFQAQIIRENNMIKSNFMSRYGKDGGKEVKKCDWRPMAG